MLNLKNEEVVALVDELAELTGESKTAAVRNAVEERIHRIRASRRDPASIRRNLEAELWSRIKPDYRGRELSTDEIDRMTGYDEHGLPG